MITAARADAAIGSPRSFRSTAQFARVVGLAATLDALDRGRDLAFEAGAFRVPVSVVGIDLPTPTLTPWLATALGLVWFLGGALLVVGSTWLQRIGALGVIAGSGVALTIDQQLFSNHTWLLWSLAFLIVIGRPAFVEFTVRSQVSIVYVFAALSKVRSPWLDGDILRRSADGVLGLIVARDLPDSTLMTLAGATIVGELALAAIIWSERFRPCAILLAAMFHLGIILIIGMQLGLAVFALAMFAHFFLPPLSLLPAAGPTRAGDGQLHPAESASTRNPVRIPRSTMQGR